MRYFLLLIYAIIVSTLFLCSNSEIAGGGDDFPNSIIGTIVDTSGIPSPNTQVQLVPYDYNPLAGAELPTSYTDTTDSLGTYRLSASVKGAYTIEALNAAKGTRALITGIDISSEITSVAPVTMTEPGIIKLFLPDTVDTAGGFVFVKGTTLLKSLSGVTPAGGGNYALIIDSVPAAQLPGFHYDIPGDPFIPELLSDTVAVAPNDITATEAFLYWVNYTKENSGLTNNEINEMRIAADGKVWIGTSGGVAVLDSTGWTQYTTANSALPSNVIMDLNFDKNGIVWIATLGGIASFDGTQWTVLDSANSGLPTDYCISAVVDRNDTLWCGMYDGIAKYTGISWVVYDTFTTSLPSCRVEDIAIDSSGFVWFATYNSILKYDNGSWEIYNTGNSTITSNLVYEVEVDRDDNKWFGYSGGASRFDNSNWTGFDQVNSAAMNSSVIQIYSDAKNNVWIGSHDGLTRFDGTAWKDYMGEQYARLDSKGMYAIAVDKEENVWTGTYENGVYVFGPTVK